MSAVSSEEHVNLLNDPDVLGGVQGPLNCLSRVITSAHKISELPEMVLKEAAYDH